MRHGWLFIVSLGLALSGSGCFRNNPLYCDSHTPCSGGQLCNTATNQCGPGVADMAGRDLKGVPLDLTMSMPDLRISTSPDLFMPPQPDLAKSPCTRNFQCNAANSVCDYSTGNCHDTSKIAYVNDNNGCKSNASPFCSLTDAVNNLGSYDVILFQPGMSSNYGTGQVVKLTGTVRLVGQRANALAAPIVLTDVVAVDMPSVATTVGIEDLELNLSNRGNVYGVLCSQNSASTNLSVLWSIIDHAPSGGLEIENCDSVVLISNQINHNGGFGVGGVNISSPRVTLFNNIIVDNGSNILGTVGLALHGNVGGTIAFNTVTGNRCNNNPCNLACDQSVPMSYSIVLDKSSVGSNCMLSNSVVPSDSSNSNGNQNNVTPDFVDTGSDNYRLQNTANNNKLLVPDPNPAVNYDLDGNPRPVNGKVDIGASQPPQ